ncbi:MAG: methyltransferase domain-containing protein [Thermoplasmataceae archaeon]|jgi:ubiquinone/menaquinone biosynthesis C-methylase UbiE
MSSFEEYFSKHASEYAKSKSHKSGEDLKSLLTIVNPESSWKALDMATGTGFTAMAIAPFVSEVIGLDATEEMLSNAVMLSEKSGLRNVKFIKGRVEHSGLEGGSFDLVTCRRAAHHFPDKTAFVVESKRVLKDGGLFALIDMVRPEKDKDNVRNRLEILRDSSHVDAPTVKFWSDLLSKNGFREVETISTKERIAFPDFLSPVNVDSEEGKACLDYLKSISRESLVNADIDPDDLSIIKERVIFLYRKVE